MPQPGFQTRRSSPGTTPKARERASSASTNRSCLRSFAWRSALVKPPFIRPQRFAAATARRMLRARREAAGGAGGSWPMSFVW
eukprot:6269475-Pyramimonas_sp.AAC.1